MLSGTTTAESPTDQQCEHCGRWFENCAVQAHQENCPVGENPYVRYNEDRDELEKRRCGGCDRLIPWNASFDDGRYHKPPCPLL